jgi:hypothetical protein
MFQSVLHPDWYHGHNRTPPFFEGWYFKLVNRMQTARYAVIPGVFLHRDLSQQHAFIQVLDGIKGVSWFHVYPMDDFSAARDRFEVRIGRSIFSSERILLDIFRPDQKIKGELHFPVRNPWPVTLASPGIMGWYAWVPTMECYHGVLSFDHEIEGELEIDGSRVDFSGGRGYIEKDWGKSFPQAWIWLQTNHFEQPQTCITASVAIIPWRKNAFTGYIAGLWQSGKLYRFATYTGARIERLDVADTHITWHISSREYLLELEAVRAEGGLLHAPTTANMGRRIAETLNAQVNVRLFDRQGASEKLLFAGTGQHAGLEVEGDLNRLRALLKLPTGGGK